jgi:ATP-dependent DNA helicase RecQ
MHKSKGQEFNTVFLYLDNLELNTPADYRLLYVALTRAEENLHVYTNANELKASIGEYGNWIERSDPHYELNAIQLQFGLKHINLGRIKHHAVQDAMRLLHSGSKIALDANYQSAVLPDGRKISFSKFAKDKLSTWTDKGYSHEMTLLDRIVIWRDIKDSYDRSYRVPILRVHLRK